jgi:hypothetical protein
MSFLYQTRGGGGGGGVLFNDVVEILESDNTVTIRHMNPDGGFYHTADVQYDDDSYSLDLGDDDVDGMTFLDAVEDELGIDDNNIDYFQSNRYVRRDNVRISQ